MALIPNITLSILWQAKLTKIIQLIIAAVYLQSLNKNTNGIDTYKSQLACITGIINQFNSIADPIILGDFQSCPIVHESQRYSPPNALSKHLSKFILENNLLPIDITHGHGPCFTYHHLTLPNSSYIDHIMIQPSLFDFLQDTRVLDPDFDNTGDHLPVTGSFYLPTSSPETIYHYTDDIESRYIDL